MYGVYADSPQCCPEPSLVPPERPENLVECCWCHEQVEASEIIQFSNGDQVCGDCLQDYLEDVGSEYAEEFATSQRDFIQWWSTEFIGYNTRMSILKEVFKSFTPEERQKAYKEFAWACGQEFRDCAETRMGGVRLDRV